MSWSYDFSQLHHTACPAGEVIGCVALFGSTPPPKDSI